MYKPDSLKKMYSGLFKNLGDYARFISKGRDRLDISQELMRYEMLEIDVKQLCGFNFECLKELFRMGYTLKPPEYEMTLSEIAKFIDEEKGE
jgi:hypothetical protein